MVNRVPRVMISSTFYDLQQVRADLVSFLMGDLGWEPLVSELSSFPVDPDTDAVENCRRRVEREADILVLIIGGRYGFVDSQTSRSVTNIEYLAARAKGIPIYVFIKRNVAALLPVYGDNPDADFSSTVDDSRLLEFAAQVRNEDKVWTYEFDLANEIVQALRLQLAYLSSRGLALNQRFRDPMRAVYLELLSGQALRFALERPLGWEIKLFADALVTEIGKRRELRKRSDLGIAIGRFDQVLPGRFESWLSQRTDELSALIKAFETVFNEELPIALGPQGSNGDPERLAFAARSVGSIYGEALEWSLRWRRTSYDPILRPVADAMTKAVADLVSKIEGIGPQLKETISEMDEAIAQGDQPRRQILVAVEFPEADEVLEAVELVRQRIHEMDSEEATRG